MRCGHCRCSPLFPQRLYKFVFEWQQKETQDYLLKILGAFVITGAVGFVLDKKGFKLQENPGPHRFGLACSSAGSPSSPSNGGCAGKTGD